jgi:hypothetical protein
MNNLPTYNTLNLNPKKTLKTHKLKTLMNNLPPTKKPYPNPKP